MQYITATELRTKSKELLKDLKEGNSVTLIDRSRVVGLIKPMEEDEAPPINFGEFQKFIKALKPKHLIPREERDKVYRKNLEEKYKQSL